MARRGSVKWRIEQQPVTVVQTRVNFAPGPGDLNSGSPGRRVAAAAYRFAAALEERLVTEPSAEMWTVIPAVNLALMTATVYMRLPDDAKPSDLKLALKIMTETAEKRGII